MALYDAYVRPLRPKLVVLVFVPNDFRDNFPLWDSLRLGVEPSHLPHANAARADDGGFRLRPPDPDWRRFVFGSLKPQWETVGRARRASWFLQWLHELQRTALQRDARSRTEQVVQWMDLLSRRPAHAPLLDEWLSAPREELLRIAGPFSGLLFAEGGDSPFFAEALAYTAFGLDEFSKRAVRDGAALVILASHSMSRFEDGLLARLEEMAAARGIPVIDQGGFIRRQGAELRDAHWKRDGHWNSAGHRWAAQALLEWLKQNQEVCG